MPIRAVLVATIVAAATLLTAVSLSSVNRYKLGFASANRSTEAAAKRRHRLAHWLAFGGLAFSLSLLGRNFAQRLLALTSVVSLGAFIEWLQHLIYTHPLETWDIRDDSYGALVGFLAAPLALAVILRLHQTRENRPSSSKPVD